MKIFHLLNKINKKMSMQTNKKLFIPVEIGLAVYLIIFRETFFSHCLSAFDALYTIIVPCLVEHLWEVLVHYWQRTSSTNVISHFLPISWMNFRRANNLFEFSNMGKRFLVVTICVLQKLIFKFEYTWVIILRLLSAWEHCSFATTCSCECSRPEYMLAVSLAAPLSFIHDSLTF